MKARTRFAPSPTGYIHVGNVRSALYPYLIAKQTGGDFILRIEDTDQARFVDGVEDLILDTLKWLGLDWDQFMAKKIKKKVILGHIIRLCAVKNILSGRKK